MKIFLQNCSEIVKKIWRNVGNTLCKFLNILMEILLHFLVNSWKNLWKIIGKIWKIRVLYGFCYLQECSYHFVHHDCTKYFLTSNQLFFQFLRDVKTRVRLYGHKEKSIVSKMITKIINLCNILSLFKIVKIYHY